MDAHRHVGRCYHGYTELTDRERLDLYGSRPISLGTDRYHWVDTLFSLPEATLLAGIIEQYEGSDVSCRGVIVSSLMIFESALMRRTPTIA